MKPPTRPPDKARDFLTSLWDQAAIMDFFRREAERCVRTGSPLGVLRLLAAVHRVAKCTAALEAAKTAGQNHVSFAPWQEFRSGKDVKETVPQPSGTQLVTAKTQPSALTRGSHKTDSSQ